MIAAELERARPPAGPGFGDAVTFAFGDPAAEVYGSARLGLVPGEEPRATGLAMLFAGHEPVAVSAQSADPGTAGWDRLEVGDLVAEIVDPLRAWRIAFDGEAGGFDLAFSALGAPVELGPGVPAADAAGLEGYEQLCRVQGSVRDGARRREIDALGQRGHQWGAPDWERIVAARTVSAWLGPDLGVTLAAVRPSGAEGHDEDALSAFLVESPGGTPGVAVPVGAPRLSTLYDAGGRQRRASAELWPGREAEDAYPRRLAGSVLCGTSIELGRLVLDAAFFRWTMEGRAGVGRYDVLRRAA